MECIYLKNGNIYQIYVCQFQKFINFLRRTLKKFEKNKIEFISDFQQKVMEKENCRE